MHLISDIVYRFPKDQTKKDKWMKVLSINEVKTWHRVCSLHFRKVDYRAFDKSLSYNCLLPEAIPQSYTIVPIDFAELQYTLNN